MIITVVFYMTFPELYSIHHNVLVVTAASDAQFCALGKGRVGCKSINFWPGQTTGIDKKGTFRCDPLASCFELSIGAPVWCLSNALHPNKMATIIQVSP